MLGKAHASCVKSKLDVLLLKNLLDYRGNVFIFAGDQSWHHLDNCYLTAKAAEHLPKLQPNVAAADDHEMIGQKIHLQHGRVSEIGDLINAGHGRDRGAATNVDKDALRAEQLAGHTHLVWGCKACMALVHRAVFCSLEPSLDTCARFPRDGVFA